MHLFLVRHAHALEAHENGARPLSPRGREQVRALAAFLKRTHALQTAADVWHSGLARAEETAELLVKELGMQATVVEIDGLRGDDDPGLVAAHLRHRRAPLLLVGHEPHLGLLASLLVAGEARPSRFVLKKSGMIALERNEGVWRVRWQLSPELLG
ncbi:SixA phosphatase family protein [Opitutus terrae]|uniref:Phosphohistidine phosphatase, SixA n=1 Tax=Opitutus terrae (strain DSM 11246 / JCM 15787 / PB90-1) TaxID=452637 RepID=B1ZN64_OPITP|nr:histidine phosphatase family protein [Opitutus terrae]ACB73433.1 phosphohistidine phosphatase, SixA [Opitutus terrae PB90-1]